MATTTHIENYSLALSLSTDSDRSVSPFEVGQSIARAMSEMPDDTFSFLFDEGETKHSLTLYALQQPTPGVRETIGTLTIRPVSVVDVVPV